MTKKARIVGGLVAVLWTFFATAFAMLAAAFSHGGDGSTSGLAPSAGYVVLILPIYFVVSAVFHLASFSVAAARWAGLCAHAMLLPAVVILIRDGAWWIAALALVMFPFWIQCCRRGDDPPPIDWLDPAAHRAAGRAVAPSHPRDRRP